MKLIVGGVNLDRKRDAFWYTSELSKKVMQAILNFLKDINFTDQTVC